MQVVPGFAERQDRQPGDVARLVTHLERLAPKVWQIELMDHVTCCSSAIRTRLAQKKAVSVPFHDIDQRPPASGGSSSEAAVRKGNARETLRIPWSASKSGQNPSGLVAVPVLVHARASVGPGQDHRRLPAVRLRR